MLRIVKTFYNKRILPRLINCACSVEACAEQRAQVIPQARGDVLEIGFGSGLNLPFYDPQHVDRVWAVEPAKEMWEMAKTRVAEAAFPVSLIPTPAEELPLAENSVDTVVITYTLCTIADPPAALREIQRVLRPEGRVLFCEHGIDPNARVRRWQNRLDSPWSSLFGGCHINRDIPELLQRGGFRIESLWAGNIPDLRIVSFNYRGEAVPA